MRRVAAYIGAILLLALFAEPAMAAPSSSITRRAGYLLIWNSIKRPTEKSGEKPFVDIGKQDPDFVAITYGKHRGIIDDDEESFRPGEPLALSDALLWLFRTRNVDDHALLTRENLPTFLERYPIATPSDRTLTEEELRSLIARLDEALATEVHEVSFYSEKFQGDGTAFGESFDMHALTAAHRTFPWNTLVRVTNAENGKSVLVRINDRGPFVKGRDMDLSLAAFQQIAAREQGKIRATFQRLGDINLLGMCEEEAREQTRLDRRIRLQKGVPHTLALGKKLVLRSLQRFQVAAVEYPDGTAAEFGTWVEPGETFDITPSVEGKYVFAFRTEGGKKKKMPMTVVRCS